MSQHRSRAVDPLKIGAIAVPVVALLVLAIDGYLISTKPDGTASLFHAPFPWMLVAVPIVLLVGFVLGSRSSPIVPLLVILIAIAEERFQQPLLPQGSINLRLDELLAPSITFGCVTREWMEGRLRRDLARLPGLIPLGLFLVANLAPTVLIMQDHARGASLYIILLGGATCYIGVAILAARVGSVAEMLGSLVVIGTLEATIGLVALSISVWQGQPTSFGVQVDPVTRIIEPYGTMYEGNFFGQYLAAILLIAIVLLMHRVTQGYLRSWVTLALALVAIVIAAGVITSETRASWLGLGLGLILLTVLWPLRGTQGRTQGRTQRTAIRRALRWLPAVALPLALVISAVAVVAISGPSSPLAQRLSSVFNFTSGSGYGRIRVLQLVLGDLSNPLLGMGDGSFNIALPPGLNQTPDGHPWIYSMFLAVLHDSGTLGLILWLLFLGVIYFRLIRVIRSDAQPELQTYAIAMGVALTSLLVSAQATTSMYLMFFWAFLGLAGAVPGIAALRQARDSIWGQTPHGTNAEGRQAGRQDVRMELARTITAASNVQGNQPIGNKLLGLVKRYKGA